MFSVNYQYIQTCCLNYYSKIFRENKYIVYFNWQFSDFAGYRLRPQCLNNDLYTFFLEFIIFHNFAGQATGALSTNMKQKHAQQKKKDFLRGKIKTMNRNR